MVLNAQNIRGKKKKKPKLRLLILLVKILQKAVLIYPLLFCVKEIVRKINFFDYLKGLNITLYCSFRLPIYFLCFFNILLMVRPTLLFI
jgi:hypothetical protein